MRRACRPVVCVHTARDRAQKIVSIDIGADLAGCRRRLKKCPKRGSEPLLEVGGQGVECRVSRVQGRGESAFGCDKVHITLHPSRQRLAWLVSAAKTGAASAQASISRRKTAAMRSERCGKWR